MLWQIKKRTYPHKLTRKMRKMRGFQYRGFQIELYNNHWYDFRYEYKLKPIGPTSLRLTKYKGKFHKVIHDVTSMRTLKPVVRYAKIHVSIHHSPFYCKR